MKLVLFDKAGEPVPGLATERGIVDISGAVAKGYAPQLTMQGIIDGFDRLLIEFASTVMTLDSGDLVACGTNHEGLGALQDGETVEIERIGRMALNVVDPLKRSWERGVCMGADSTNPEAVERHRPQA